MTRARLSFAATLCAALGIAARAQAREVEVGVQTLATLVSDDETKGGGIGLGVEGSMRFAGEVATAHGPLWLGRARVSLLGGGGLVWGAEAGAVLRWRVFLWQPEAGVSLLYLGGDLARSIDERGRVASNPFAPMLGLSPLRFQLDQGWMSFLGLRGGITLGRSGHPPLAASITLFEVGQTF